MNPETVNEPKQSTDLQTEEQSQLVQVKRKRTDSLDEEEPQESRRYLFERKRFNSFEFPTAFVSFIKRGYLGTGCVKKLKIVDANDSFASYMDGQEFEIEFSEPESSSSSNESESLSPVSSCNSEFSFEHNLRIKSIMLTFIQKNLYAVNEKLQVSFSNQYDHLKRLRGITNRQVDLFSYNDYDTSSREMELFASQPSDEIDWHFMHKYLLMEDLDDIYRNSLMFDYNERIVEDALYENSVYAYVTKFNSLDEYYITYEEMFKPLKFVIRYTNVVYNYYTKK